MFTYKLRTCRIADSYKFRAKSIECNIPDNLPFVVDRASLAATIGVELQTLCFLLQKGKYQNKPTFIKNTLYQCYKIPKPQTRRDKEMGRQRYRNIQNPSPKLKSIHKNLLLGFWEHFPLPDYVTSFRRGISIQDAAKKHAGRDLIVSIDLKDFFPTIKEYMIRAFLLEKGYPYPIARTISEISTFTCFLPQGSPSSPAISNILGYHLFDKEIRDLAEQSGFLYTRYADDLIFSNETKDAVVWGEADQLLLKIGRIIKKAGFKIAQHKTKFMRTGNRQKVLGSIVNTPPEHDPAHGNWGHIRIPMRDYLNIRATLHDCRLNGVSAAAERQGRTAEQLLSYLGGYINSYMKQTDERRWLKLAPQFDIIKRTYKDRMKPEHLSLIGGYNELPATETNSSI